MRAHAVHVGAGHAGRPAWPAFGFPLAVAERLGDLATAALIAELETWPKPGLVSPVDPGSHHDMDADTFRRSAASLRPYFVRLAMAGAACAGMGRLREIGLAAEAAMLDATGGVNTHRGALFALGLLCAAAGAARAEGRTASPADTVRHRWRDAILCGPPAPDSHGSRVAHLFGAGGARAEAAAGFPHIRHIGLPALHRGRALAHDEAGARVHAFFCLLAAVDDTNLLHRGGAEGLRYAQTAAQRFLAAGSVGQPDWLPQAVALHRAFTTRRLSPGGCADLLAATLFLDWIETEP